MTEIMGEVFTARGVRTKDAGSSTGGGDFLERILGLIRNTGFTVAIFSHQTRPNALANIHLELGFAAMCGKPLIIIKSKRAKAPSDLNRTDWIEYDENKEEVFRERLNLALDTVDESGPYETMLLEMALRANTVDCAIALERASRAFLLTSDPDVLGKAEEIGRRLNGAGADALPDLQRLKHELGMFIRQGKSALMAAAALVRHEAV